MPTQQTSELTMPQELHSALQALDNVFVHLLPEVSVVMGGGTVLAARWDHRRSTDIDLFVSPKTMITLMNQMNLSYQGAVTRLQTVGNATMEPFNGFLSGEIGSVPFSLAASEFIKDNRLGDEQVGSTNFQAATNQEILAGKIQGRLHRRSSQPVTAPVRDLYDIIVARHMAPGLVNSVLDGITPKGRAVIANDLKLLPENLHETDPKRLMNPRYRVELQGIAGTVAAAIEAGDESLLPATVRVEGPSFKGPSP